ncbi:hypothetical protein [Hallella sp.]|uniref:hypothetical protein n=1 Tax=Hallella sp. TaxID=2980186 RepID=UPI0030799E55
MKLKRQRVLDEARFVGMGCELGQQTILQSTLFLATTKRLGGNTQFSAHLPNNLTNSNLSQK